VQGDLTFPDESPPPEHLGQCPSSPGLCSARIFLVVSCLKMKPTRSPDRSWPLTPPSTCCATFVCSTLWLCWVLSWSARILGFMGQMEALIPAWVAPTAREVADCHWIAHSVAAEVGRASIHGEVCSILDWVTTDLPEQAAVHARVVDDDTSTLAWLLGFTPVPPIELPRRNPDGTVVTVEQVTAELLAGKTGMPEQRRDAETKARRQVARWRRLASLVPH
jgi:hypothetical protein